MPINFGGYTFKPPALQYGGLADGLNDIIQGNRERARQAQQESQYERTRGDTQATTAADFALKRGDTAHSAVMERYQKQQQLIDAATKAAQKGDWNTARALRPRILELGGEATESGSPNAPVFRFKAGAAPQRAPLDIAGARQQIYQGAPEGTPAGQPFQVPGFGANGQRNPFTPPSLPGASSAALPQSPVSNQAASAAGGATSAMPPPDAAGPPPGAAVDGPLTPPDGAVWLPPASAESAPEAPAGPPPGAPPSSATQAAQSGQPGSEQPTGPNPFDPYTIDTSQVTASNRLRLDPMLTGIANATPQRYRSRVQQFNQGLGDLRLDPTATLDAAKPYFEQLAGMYRGEVAAEGQANRLDQTGAHQESVLADKARDRGIRRVKGLISVDGLTKTKDKLNVSEGIYDLIKAAGKNPQVAAQLIAQLYRMNQSGVMTDKDYDHTKEGVASFLGAVKNFTLDKLLAERGGLNPDTIADMTEFVDIALRNHRKNMSKARDTLYRAYQGAQNEYEKEGIGDEMKAIFPEEYWPEEFKANWDPNSGTVPEHDPEDEEAVMQQMQEQENLGVAPLPRADRRDPTTGRPIGSRVPMRPPRRAASNKPVEKLTDAELKEEMNKILE
jgi:hypothetical protein